jgi:hypothetical protein
MAPEPVVGLRSASRDFADDSQEKKFTVQWIK